MGLFDFLFGHGGQPYEETYVSAEDSNVMVDRNGNPLHQVEQDREGDGAGGVRGPKNAIYNTDSRFAKFAPGSKQTEVEWLVAGVNEYLNAGKGR